MLRQGESGGDTLAPGLLSLGRMPSPLRGGLAALLLLGSTAARAQTSITLAFPGTPNNLQVFGPNVTGKDCTSKLRVTWTATSLSSNNICNSLQIWVSSSSSCGNSPGTGATDGGTDLVLDTQGLTTVFTGVTPDVVVNQIPGLVGQDCTAAQLDVTDAVCASVQTKDNTGACSGSFVAGQPLLTVRFDNIPPDPPSISLNPQDSKIIVSLSANGSQAADVLTFNVEIAEVTDGGSLNFRPAGTANANGGSFTIEGLINDTTYAVQASAVDEANNPSLPSEIATATPLASDGFWATYKKDGGEELGGCNAGGAAVPSAIAAAVALGVFLRRRR